MWDRPTPETLLARVRRAVRERLDSATAADRVKEPLSIEDARLLIARAEGFGSWDELTA
jgi:hypothetical protein